ncbi:MULTISPECIES: hypothetical protein [Maribacter]|uniref:Uncharacterized protein n=1 Tax=Maribacter dokdonensis TaxID=320912 RepID=A0ABY0V067_9FLAO|nr:MULTISPECIES: hypothetical protein [Maribacter]HAF78040.1 hypothetical protein [Maribacter sp.]APA63875.1 hypothetical protein YQ22_05885 [Maribacter sp. 1_2014MBL_MicDiv]MBU2901044.1 hypothetical protein [Maribacter dokdonensis]MDF4220661.1 hypothetical protein [Maribacter huludaoensis]PHN95392.1 hypothetical protein CSC80_08690 [Maribacter sp. 6B07]|tara:strand:+ start:3186 stop:3368 length:183 start_codon:yes stop_codon:yes gene_type:complete
MKINKWIYIGIALFALILFVMNMVDIDHSTAHWKAYMGPVSNIILIIAMVLMFKFADYEK